MVPPFDGQGVREAVFGDPAGHPLRALHVFRRSPVISITLPCSDPRAAAAAYTAVFGCRALTSAEDVGQLYLPSAGGRNAPSPDPLAAAAVSFGPVFNSTSLVFAVPPPPADAASGEGAAAAAAVVSAGAPVVTLAVADIGAAYAGAHRVGWTVSVFHPGAADAAVSFTAFDDDGNMLHVVPQQQQQ